MELAARSRSVTWGGDEPRAWIVRLHAAHAERIYNLALRYARDAAEAEDLTQDVFVRALERAHRIDPSRNPDGWLIRLAVRVFLTSKARQRRRADVPLDDDPVDDAPRPAPTDDLDEVRAVLGQLPAKRRLVLILHYYDQHSVDEIAAITGLRVSSVNSHLTRARRQLREHFAGRTPDLAARLRSTRSTRS